MQSNIIKIPRNAGVKMLKYFLAVFNNIKENELASIQTNNRIMICDSKNHSNSI